MAKKEIAITKSQKEKLEKDISELSLPYFYSTREFTFEFLIEKFKKEKVDEGVSIYVPDYQRKFVWDIKEKSRFIESIFLGVPLPPVFGVVDNETGSIELIDGMQRVSTICAFYNNDFKIQDVEKLTTLNGFYFKDLEPSRQNKFRVESLRMQLITDRATEETKKDIFYRINTSGRKATNSEIRKGSFSGEFYNMIMKFAEDKLFNELTNLSDNKRKKGEREELILRFFAYSELGEDGKLKGKKFLDHFVKLKNQSPININVYETQFNNMLEFVNKYFPNGFKKERDDILVPRVRFEAIAVGVNLALKKTHSLVPLNMNWLNEPRFKQETTSDGSINSNRPSSRILYVRDMLLNRTPKDYMKYEQSDWTL